MAKVNFFTTVFFALAWLLAGCVQLPPAKPTGLTSKGFWKEQNARFAEVSKISAKLGLDYQGIKESVSGQARMVALLPQHFRLELRDPFGTLRYVVTLAEKDFTAYFPTLKMAYIDDTAGKSYLKSTIGTELSFAEVQGLALGLIPKSMSTAEFTSWEWEPGKGQYVAKYEVREKKLTLFVDPERAVLRELWINSATNGMTKMNFTEFGVCCGNVGPGARKNIFLAHVVSLVHEHSKTSLEVEWKDIDRLEKAKSDDIFRAELPADVQKVHLP